MKIQGTIKFCDLHCDTAMELINGATLDNKTTQVNIPFMKEGHVALQLFACYVPPSIPKNFRVSIVMELRPIERYQRDNNNGLFLNKNDYDTLPDNAYAKRSKKEVGIIDWGDIS